MNSYEVILQAMDTSHRDILLAAADACEENGEELLASGYRWMANNNRWPRRPTRGEGWKWYLWPKESGWQGGDEEDVPEVLALVLTGIKSKTSSWTKAYESVHGANEALARAAGLWLQEQAEKEKT